MRILITGASGFLGTHLVPALRRSGHAVATLSRGGAGAAGHDLAGPAELSTIGDWAGWPAGIEAVIHLAALNPARRDAAWGDAAALMRANGAGTGALARRAARAGVGRFLFLSTAKVHGATRDGSVTEATPFDPPDAYARSKLAGEAALAEALAGTGTAGLILRPVPVFGPGGRGLVASLGRLARLPVPLPLGGVGAPRSLLSVDSLLRAVEAGLAAPLEAGVAPGLLLADRGALDPAGIVSALRAGLGRSGGTLALPFAGPVARRLLGAGGGGLLGPFAVDPSRAERHLGWRPAPDVAAALASFAAASRPRKAG